MADIVNYFNWTYISTVASSGEYGEQGIDSFQREARARNICIAVTAKLPHSSTPAHFEGIIRELQVGGEDVYFLTLCTYIDITYTSCSVIFRPNHSVFIRLTSRMTL